MAKGKKTGGRTKGTPNKENPLKGYLRSHSLDYFEPKPQVDQDGKPREIFAYVDGDKISVGTLADANGDPLVMSDFDADMLALKPMERVMAELKLLKFHTPEMKAIDMDMSVEETSRTIEQRLAELAGEEEI